MHIQQFYDKGLAHASYAVLSKNEVALIDPARDPKPYYNFAEKHSAQIVAVIETHPHADFVSSHLQIHLEKSAVIYTSKLTGADYPHKTLEDGDVVKLGNIELKAYHTPGHSPDSLSIIVKDENKKDVAVFSGDTLFIGDVGRPDLREKAGNIWAKREELAREMYHSTRKFFMKLDNDVMVYPAHGSGSLCGKNLSSKLSSTIGEQLRENYALQPMTEEEFVKLLLSDQPFIPKYFGYNVEINKAGAEILNNSVSAIKRKPYTGENLEGLIVDVRPAREFKASHIKGSINIPEDGKFETWLGSVVAPDEKYYLIAGSHEDLETAILKASKIGYETLIKEALIWKDIEQKSSTEFDVEDFRSYTDRYTIVDIRNESERKDKKIFEESLNIPLPELRERVSEVPADKPIVVHCSGGYRSAIGSSIIERHLQGKVPVYDLGEYINDFQEEAVK